jgi:HEPN domain-containing protein
MSDKKRIEEAEHWYKSAEDELDSGAILMMHKKHYHACFHARQAVIDALKAAWCLKDREPGDKTGPELIRQLQKIDNKTFLKLENRIDDLEKIARIEPRDIPPAKTFAKKDSEFFINTAYKILAQIKTLVITSG